MPSNLTIEFQEFVFVIYSCYEQTFTRTLSGLAGFGIIRVLKEWKVCVRSRSAALSCLIFLFTFMSADLRECYFGSHSCRVEFLYCSKIESQNEDYYIIISWFFYHNATFYLLQSSSMYSFVLKSFNIKPNLAKTWA